MFWDVLIPDGQEAQRGVCMFWDVLIPDGQEAQRGGLHVLGCAYPR